MKDYRIENGNIIFSINTALDGVREYSVPIQGGIPKIFYTATSDMRDCICNVVDICGSKCSAQGVYRGREQIIKNIIILDDKIKKVGQRIMVTEHLNIDGQMELVATTKRILDIKNPNLNFINISTDAGYLRIDPYTGSYKIIKCGSLI